MGNKTPPHKEYPEWTEARYRQFVRGGLRQLFNRWPPKYRAMEAVTREVEGKRWKYEAKCAACKKWHKRKDCQVDHIEPAGSTLESFDAFIEKLLVGEAKLQVLCKACHKKKTDEERKKK
jgi:hypothetical protein